MRVQFCTSPTHNPINIGIWLGLPGTYTPAKKGGKTISGGLPSCSGHAQNLHDADRHLWSFAVQL